MEKKKTKKQTREQRYKEALEKIASACTLKESVRDYPMIGKNAVVTAQIALIDPCPRCGK